MRALTRNCFGDQFIIINEKNINNHPYYWG